MGRLVWHAEHNVTGRVLAVSAGILAQTVPFRARWVLKIIRVYDALLHLILNCTADEEQEQYINPANRDQGAQWQKQAVHRQGSAAICQFAELLHDVYDHRHTNRTTANGVADEHPPFAPEQKSRHNTQRGWEYHVNQDIPKDV